MGEKPLSDNEVAERLQRAMTALGTAPGVSQGSESALKTARRALHLIWLGLLKYMEDRDRSKDPPAP